MHTTSAPWQDLGPMAFRGIHLGTVGEQLTTRLECIKIVETRHPPMFPGDKGVSYLHVCKDEMQNTLIYTGVAAGFPLVGQSRLVRFTVSKHTTYKGTAQTHIKRPKVLKDQND